MRTHVCPTLAVRMQICDMVLRGQLLVTCCCSHRYCEVAAAAKQVGGRCLGSPWRARASNIADVSMVVILAVSTMTMCHHSIPAMGTHVIFMCMLLQG